MSQTYITPEAFSIDLGLYFFVSIIVGGRANLLGPFIGAVLLASLPQLLGGWARYSTIGYGIILLLVVLLLPEGFSTAIRKLGDRIWRTRLAGELLKPDLAMPRAMPPPTMQPGGRLEARAVSIRFHEVVALDAVSLTLEPGRHLAGAHLVQADERPDHLPLSRPESCCGSDRTGPSCR